MRQLQITYKCWLSYWCNILLFKKLLNFDPLFVTHIVWRLRKEKGIYDFIKRLIREYVWLSCWVSSSFSSFSTVVVPKNFNLCTYIIWGISNTAFCHSCFRYTTNHSCMKLIFFSEYGEKQIQKRKQNGKFKLSP